MGELVSALVGLCIVIGSAYGFLLWCRDVVVPRIRRRRGRRSASAPQWEAVGD